MADAASTWAARGYSCWFVVPRPRNAFRSGSGRPPVADLIAGFPPERQPVLVAPVVGAEFEFGTEGYRARAYARAVQRSVPRGVPIIVSDDPAAWRAVALLGGRNPLIGVLHADEAPYYALAARYQRSAAAIVAVSQRVSARARHMVATWHVATEVIPCGIPLPPLRDDGPEGRAIRLVWVGRITEPQKRVSDLPAIARSLRDAGHAFQLDIIGDGEDAAALRASVEQSQLGEHIRFHGWLSSSVVLSILSRSELFLLPSNYEGMPVAAMEALASGCGVIGSDTCGLEEYAGGASVRDALWIYPRGDVAAATRSIAAASLVARERRRVGAREFAEREFSIDRCVDRYAQLLERLAAGATGEVSVSSWHPADVVSWMISRARMLRAQLRQLVARGRQLADTAATPSVA